MQKLTSLKDKLKTKWGLENGWQVLAILLVFSLAGSTSVLARKALFDVLGYEESTAFWLKAITYIAFLFPTYQLLLLAYGFVFGQFQFFWSKEKKMVEAIRSKF